MDSEKVIARDNNYVLHTYNRNPIVLEKGHGVHAYGPEGQSYLDFTSGIWVNSLGYCDLEWAEAVSRQAHKLQHTSNLYYTAPCSKLAKALCRRTGMNKVFFGNSGAEANEGAIRAARKYSHDRDGDGHSTVITLVNSVHGRTLATLTATGQDKFHNYFFPFPEGFRYADANDLDSVEAVAGHDVCAVVMELVQGEGGVLPLEEKFVRGVADLCAKRDWLLLIDEVQTGLGRTGALFAFQKYGVRPDAASFAKGIAGGLPFGGVMAGEKCRDVFTPGTHGSTFGGNPVSAAAACYVLDRLDGPFLAQVEEKGAYLRQKVEELNLPCLGATRGMGLMIGVEVKGERTNSQLAARLVEAGLLILTAGPDLRLLPPLVITKEEMDKGLAIMKTALS